MKVKKGDTVVVIAGKDKGAKGKVIQAYPTRDRVLVEVFEWFAEPVPDFVRRRHRELASRGLTNDQIFAAVATELAERRFPPPALTSRQLRRLVYG
jgi:hypothetical protein